MSYREVKDPNHGVDVAKRDTFFLRYDATHKRVVEFDKEDQEERPRTCDLSASFNTTIFCEAWGDDMMVDGGYIENPDSYSIGVNAPFRAGKGFYNIGGGENYYHGVGRLPGIGDG